MAERKTLSQFIGNIKREYTKDDFNPFHVMSSVYNTMLVGGVGSRVAIVGFGERYEEHMVRSWWHVLSSKNLISGDRPPVPVDGLFTTNNGCVIEFIGLTDTSENQVRFQEIMDRSQIVALCSRYEHPNLKTIIQSHSQTHDLYDFSQNNIAKVVDKDSEE